MSFASAFKRVQFPVSRKVLVFTALGLYSLLAVSLHKPQPVIKTRTILALYHFWDGTEDVLQSLAANWRPIFPIYSTKNATITARQVSWAVQNSVDGFIVPWRGVNSTEDIHLRQGLLRSSNIELLKYALYYKGFSEMYSLGKRAQSRKNLRKDSFRQTLRFAKDRFFDHPSYFRIDGKPVLIINFNPALAGPSESAVKKARDFAGSPLFIIGDVCGGGNAWNTKSFIEEAKKRQSTYNAYFCSDISLMHEGKTQGVLLQYFKTFVVPIYTMWFRHRPFIPTVMPCFKKFGEKGFSALESKAEDFAEQISLVRQMQLLYSRGRVSDFLVVQSFNDWFSGTAMEPTRKIGYDYLNVLHSLQ